jgi:hypothetical protein
VTLIHIGDGRHIDTEEGAKFSPPPRKKAKLTKGQARYRPEGAPKGRSLKAKGLEGRSGVDEYEDFYQEYLMRYRKTGRAVGEVPGVLRRKNGYVWGWAKRKAKIDMEKVLTAFPDIDASAAEALEAALTVMRGPQSQTQKLAAAKLVLDFTRAKPTAKSEVTINAAEDWLTSLGKDTSDTD